MAYQIGQTIRPSQAAATGQAPGSQSFDYGRVGPNAPGRIKDSRIVNGELYYDIDQTGYGGGTGWVRASDLGGGGSGGGRSMGSGRSSFDSGGDTKGAFDMALSTVREGNKEAREGLTASKEGLKGRYDELINSIKGNQKTAENRAERTQSRELARRGILPSSGLYDQTVEEYVNPVTSEYAGHIANTGVQRERDLSTIDQALAQLSSSAVPTAMNYSLGLMDRDLGLMDRGLARDKFSQIELPYSQAQIANMGNTGQLDLATFLSLFGGGLLGGGSTGEGSIGGGNSTTNDGFLPD